MTTTSLDLLGIGARSAAAPAETALWKEHPASEPARRRGFLDWSLLYLFSFDVELDLDRQESLGRFPDGARINLYSRQDLSRVYNVGRESTVPGDGRPSITGKINWGGDQAVLRDDDIGSCNIRLSIQTDDGAVIHMTYRLFGYLGPGGVERVLSGKGGDRFGTEDSPFDVPIITSPRFQTTDPTYAWINDLQGIGFGRLQVIRNRFRRNTQDIYALT
jgi:Protein of unknown function (DUF3237)